MAEGMPLSALEATGFSLTWRLDAELSGLHQIKCINPQVPFFHLHATLSADKLFLMSEDPTYAGSGPASLVYNNSIRSRARAAQVWSRTM